MLTYSQGAGIDATTGRVTYPESREFGESMIFTVVRAVRGSEFSATEPNDKLHRLVETAAPSVSAVAMDIPCVEEVFRLDLSDFAKTIPGALE